MMHIDQSDLYRQNSAVFQNFVLYSPDPPSMCTEGLGTRLEVIFLTGIDIYFDRHRWERMGTQECHSSMHDTT